MPDTKYLININKDVEIDDILLVVVVEIKNVAVSIIVPRLRCGSPLAVRRVTEEHQT